MDADNRLRAGQAITILARVFDAFAPDELLLNTGENITAISYTCEQRKKGIINDAELRKSEGLYGMTWAAVTGHKDVPVDTNCLLSELGASDRWTRDDKGFNFVLTPDISQTPLFSDVGEYRICVKIKLSTGNPVVFYTYFTVVDVSVTDTGATETANG